MSERAASAAGKHQRAAGELQFLNDDFDGPRPNAPLRASSILSALRSTRSGPLEPKHRFRTDAIAVNCRAR